MSYQGGKKDYDPSEPSTSSGYRRPGTSSSHSSRLPYARPSESEKEHSKGIKGVLKGVGHSSGDQSASTKYDTVPIKTEPIGEGEVHVKSEKEQPRGRREPIFVSRPSTLVTKKGASGSRIVLQTNYFKLKTVPDWCLYKYRVDYEPEESRTVIRKGLLRLHKERVGPYIFDGTVLYSTARMPNQLELLSTRQQDNTHIRISIRLVGDMTRDDPHYIQFFNIIMRKCLDHMKLQLVGRNYFDARSKVAIREFRMELWPGYVTSIRQHERDILMCAEVTHKVMRQETVFDMLTESYRQAGPEFQKDFCSNVIGLVVLTDYNNNTYRIEDVDFSASPSSTFPMKNGEVVSYQEYYRKKYDIVIQHSTQPMLVTRTKPKERNAGQGNLVYLVPELCRATGLTDKMRDNFQLMRALATHTRVSPDARIQKLMSFNEKLRREEKVVQEFRDWNMTLERNLLEVPARILSSEKIIFGKEVKLNSGRGDWTRDMQKAPLLVSKELKNWIVIGCGRDQRNVTAFIDAILKVSYGIQFRVEYPQLHWIRDDKSSTYVENLEYILSRGTPELVFCVVSNNRADRYTAIKRKCCVDRPVPSQVFLQKNLQSRNYMSIATKVAIQMNCKLGGAAWHVESPLKGLMAIGFDICHDANTRGKDFLAMVATIDQLQTRYFSSITLYHNNEELVEQLCAGISKAIQAYRAYNKALPMYLIIYRDGVSGDGQTRQIYETEVEALRKKLEELYYGPNYKMMFIIVSKRINTRFFYNRQNPFAGTIVDDVVTSPFKYDFYLVSQQIRQGTVTPTSYNVIADNTGLDPEIIQVITYKLTHMYYNCSNTVRVPAPCHYAHKLSFLVGRFLHRPPNTQLENQLYFL